MWTGSRGASPPANRGSPPRGGCAVRRARPWRRRFRRRKNRSSFPANGLLGLCCALGRGFHETMLLGEPVGDQAGIAQAGEPGQDGLGHGLAVRVR